MSNTNRMYEGAKTWNPFRGCGFDCIYCVPSFQAQAKRQSRRCAKCASFKPHCHKERLSRIPSSPIVFVGGCGDLSFCPDEFMWDILDAIYDRNEKMGADKQVYYFQSKRPAYFRHCLTNLPPNVILATTLETNRDYRYEKISQAPPPSERVKQFGRLPWPRKVVTIEPVMDFAPDVFQAWLHVIDPEYVWLGFNSHPGQVQLPEPSPRALRKLCDGLTASGIPVRMKDLRELTREQLGLPPEAHDG